MAAVQSYQQQLNQYSPQLMNTLQQHGSTLQQQTAGLQQQVTTGMQQRSGAIQHHAAGLQQQAASAWSTQVSPQLQQSVAQFQPQQPTQSSGYVFGSPSTLNNSSPMKGTFQTSSIPSGGQNFQKTIQSTLNNVQSTFQPTAANNFQSSLVAPFQTTSNPTFTSYNQPTTGFTQTINGFSMPTTTQGGVYGAGGPMMVDNREMNAAGIMDIVDKLPEGEIKEKVRDRASRVTKRSAGCLSGMNEALGGVFDAKGGKLAGFNVGGCCDRETLNAKFEKKSRKL